ncbi:MAG: hypothetical protein ACI9XK_000867 [Granulosicoccus sp.]
MFLNTRDAVILDTPAFWVTSASETEVDLQVEFDFFEKVIDRNSTEAVWLYELSVTLL